MDVEGLETLLDRLGQVLHAAASPNQFELCKFSRNIEFAQDRLIESDLASTDPRGAEKIRSLVAALQATVASKQNALDRRLEQIKAVTAATARAAKEAASNAKPATVQSADARGALESEEHVLQHHRETQESLSDDLLLMAQTLRQNQQTFGDRIAADDGLIEKTGEALDRNASKMKQTGGRLSKYTRKSGWSWVYTYLAILVAFVSFLITVGLIRIT